MSLMDDVPISALDGALRSGRPIVTAEITSPAGPDVASLLRRARALAGRVVAANVPDGQAVSAHMGPLAAARLLLDAAVEPVLTLQCRDRNRLALQSDLVSAAALGVRNVLCLTGDAPPPDSSVPAVFDLDSVGLLRAATGIMAGRFLDGTVLRRPPSFVLGAAAHPFGATHDERIARLHAKADAGARFVQTQYIFDVEGFARWMEAVRAEGLHERLAVLATTGAMRTPRALAFVQALPGVVVPPAVEARLTGLDGEPFIEESLRLCAETARALLAIPGVRGVHFVAPFLEERLAGAIAAL
jgi:methylenetetrahydrofolate reductase (NADPH)